MLKKTEYFVCAIKQWTIERGYQSLLFCKRKWKMAIRPKIWLYSQCSKKCFPSTVQWIETLQISFFSLISAKLTWKHFAHLSLPWSIGWVALSFLVRLFVCLSRYGNIPTSTCPRPPNPYIFWKLMIIAIQKWIGNTNTKTKTPRK